MTNSPVPRDGDVLAEIRALSAKVDRIAQDHEDLRTLVASWQKKVKLAGIVLKRVL